MPDLTELDSVIVGINPAGVEEHARYSRQLALNFPLLSDAGGEVARRYGVLNADRSVQRSVYIIDKRGLIHFAAHGLHWVPEFYNALATLP